MLGHDSQRNKIFFDRQNLAPYLEVTPFEQYTGGPVSLSKKDDKGTPFSHREEADAAAGGASVLQRVSSFSIIPRSSSSMGLSAVGGGGPNISANASNAVATDTPDIGVRRSPSSPHPSTPTRATITKSTISQSATAAGEEAAEGVVPSWRLRDRMKTVGVGLVMALNVGTDPPDIIKPHPCAKLQCWMDPSTTSRARAKEKIGERLESQYARWQQQRAARPLKYRRALDPTVEDVRALCLWLRRQARHERILLHYNGHGVPRPTANGEIWVFDKNHTEYIPLSITDLRQWMGKPSIVVLDCSSAAILIPFLTAPISETTPPDSPLPRLSQDADAAEEERYMEVMSSQWVRDTIVLCPTSEGEWLPMHPDYPADIFTSCLTTPIKMALRWFVRRNPLSMGELHPDAVDAIPGKENDRKTPLGELNWIFTAVTDSIAWNVLPKPLFQRLFRQDLLVASMFRNFLLADRILRSLDCTPQSHPPLPPGIDRHPLWSAFDLAMETCLFGLMKDGILGNHVLKPSPAPGDKNRGAGNNGEEAAQTVHVEVTPADGNVTGPASSISSPFFSEQLTAFEVWLDFAPIRKMYLNSGMPMESPEQLPVVLQVLLSQVHRIRALRLLRKFLELGPWAVNISLSLGIFPYVMKLLQSPEYKSLLVSIWAYIIDFDSSCQVDLVKDGALQHFIQRLTFIQTSSDEAAREAAKERTLAAFILAVAANGYEQGQMECSRLNLPGTINALLSSYEAGEFAEMGPDRDVAEFHHPAPFRMWLCLCLGSMMKANQACQNEAFGNGIQQRLVSRMKDCNADVRAAACYALGCLLESPPKMNPPASPDLPSLAGPLGQAPQFQTGPSSHPLVPPRMPPGMVIPPGAPIPVGLQPSFANAPGMSNLHWHPQHQHQPQHPHQHPMLLQQPMPGGPMTGVQPMPPMQPGLMPGGQHTMLNQPLHLMPQSQPYMIPMQPNLGGVNLGGPSLGGPNLGGPNLGGPTMPVGGPSLGGPGPGFMVGSVGRPVSLDNSMFGSPSRHTGPLMPPDLYHEQTPPRQPTVYNDQPRLDFDLEILEGVANGADDGSATVRCEVIMSIAAAVGKYLDAFLRVANDQSIGRQDEPEGVDNKTPADTDGADDAKNSRPPSRYDIELEEVDGESIERFLEIWKTLRKLQHHDPHPEVSSAANDVVMFVHETLMRRRADLHADDETPRKKELAGIEEEGLSPAHFDSERQDEANPPRSDGPPHRLNPSRQNPAVLRRVASDLATPVSGIVAGSALDLSGGKNHPQGGDRGESAKSTLDYSLPKSKFYDWKKSIFNETIDSQTERDQDAELDPLSPEGATRAYQGRRNFLSLESVQELETHFKDLTPKAPKPTKQSIEDIMTPPTENAEDDVASYALKRELELRERKLLRNTGVKMTTMLKFHPFEDIIVACGAEDGVTVWDVEEGQRSVSFMNGNPKGTRMTTATWINGASTSLFLIGCDDGSARIWDGLVENNGEASLDPPRLVSSFFAASDVVAGSRGRSGLVCEWQQYSGTLIAGGDSKYLKCWDIEAEKCRNVLETDTKACLTTLTSAWDYETLGKDEPKGSPGIGPSVLVGGYSDGTMKVFDIRCNAAVAEAQSGAKSWTKRRRPTKYEEHNSWIVNTTFTGYGGYGGQIVTGGIAGDIKVWDLRMSTSQLTLEVQRSTMTALAVHKKIPVVATGSHAQFIKILTLDGDTVRVIRYHEEMSNHRIGPVSCLEWHPYKPILAAGATDTYVSIYTPKGKRWSR
ncbi:Regulatory-associated protein of TOR [Seminavis robusta]|uniref:Regulatory-associated protein of TOR n=1 Tax=Seminavis robusta TaxID=568900 RepID=A0A9N8DI27_9STRA|nr:Regulatory-associated protein of TOR [Seminavis robusta]|eukprot:Sro169_g075110.1 Regulatory-associated protein of TOR (1750) ;mRNA; r:44536-49906